MCVLCAGRCDAAPDSAGSLQSICGCANLTGVSLQSYTKLTNLSYYVGLNAILGPVSLTSDSALASLAGLEVRASLGALPTETHQHSYFHEILIILTMVWAASVACPRGRASNIV